MYSRLLTKNCLPIYEIDRRKVLFNPLTALLFYLLHTADLQAEVFRNMLFDLWIGGLTALFLLDARWCFSWTQTLAEPKLWIFAFGQSFFLLSIAGNGLVIYGW